ncbi:MAG: hypothetical protein EOP47_01935 [Sphingobacteriaceae bacterium]|nr:MAG: hypothetical protein EOP47_01935 [Sphingobacteriaceae bacterium]
MKARLLPAYFKKIGYISLIVAVSAYFIGISGFLNIFQYLFHLLFGRPLFETWQDFSMVLDFCKQISLYIFLFSIFSIVFSADPKGQASTSNRLLLPHYFKITGYIFLLLTLCLYVLLITKRAYTSESYTTTCEVEERYDHYQDKMSVQQKKAYLNMEPTAKKTIQTTVTINPISLILPIGLLFLAFSKEKVEDELITSYRAQSLQLAILLLFFLILYQKFNVPDMRTLVVTGTNSFGYFDLPGPAWKADVLINVILIFSIVRMEYLLRIKPLFNKKN